MLLGVCPCTECLRSGVIYSCCLMMLMIFELVAAGWVTLETVFMGGHVGYGVDFVTVGQCHISSSLDSLSLTILWQPSIEAYVSSDQ